MISGLRNLLLSGRFHLLEAGLQQTEILPAVAGTGQGQFPDQIRHDPQGAAADLLLFPADHFRRLLPGQAVPHLILQGCQLADRVRVRPLQPAPQLCQLGEQDLLDSQIMGIGLEFLVQGIDQQAQQAEFFIKGRGPDAGGIRPGRAAQNLRYTIDISVFIVQVIISGKGLGNDRILQILADQVLGHCRAQLFINIEDPGQIFPAAGRHEIFIIDLGTDGIEMIPADLQIGHDCPVDSDPVGILFPGGIILFNFDPLHTVQSNNIEIPDRPVVLGRVACRNDQEAVRYPVRTEGLVLEELQHGGRQCLGDTVDLIQEKDPF